MFFPKFSLSDITLVAKLVTVKVFILWKWARPQIRALFFPCIFLHSTGHLPTLGSTEVMELRNSSPIPMDKTILTCRNMGLN